MQTEKQKSSREEVTRASLDKIVLSMRAFGNPLTAEGIADESGFPNHFIRIMIPKLLDDGRIKPGPEDVELGKTYEVL